MRAPRVPRRRTWQFWRPDVAAEVDEELAFHLEMRAAEYETQGCSRAEAERAAHERFGDVGPVRQQLVINDAARERRHIRRERMHHLAHDVRLALRGFRRTPAFVGAVIAILALGIGAAVATFTTAAAVLARPLPVADQDRLAVLWPYQVPGTEASPEAAVLAELRRTSRTMRAVAGVAHWGTAAAPYPDGDRVTVLQLAIVTSNYFDVLGARPSLGRLLRPEDGAAGAPQVMVLSYGAWRRQFDGSPSVLGRRLLDPNTRRPYTVVGVAPPGLDYPVGAECWIAMRAGSDLAALRVFTIARLAPGASLDAARTEFFGVLARTHPEQHLTGATAVPLERAVLGSGRPPLIALTVAVALLLFIACANVGTLFLVRALGRGREFAVRRALGAGVGALVRQLVVESALLGVAGGALGAIFAAAFVRGLVAAAPTGLPRLDAVRPHGALLGVALGVTTVAVLLFGVLPALAAADVASPLRRDARSGGESRGRSRARDGLVAVQVALALVLVVGAGLLARSLTRLEALPLGFRPEHVTVVSVAPAIAKYDSKEKFDALGERLERAIAAVPGVRGVTPLLTEPFGGATINLGWFEGEGQTAEQLATNAATPWDPAGVDHFRVLGIPILRGRAFTESDREGAPNVAVVSEDVAWRLWPGQDPLGRRLRLSPSRTGTTGEPAWVFEWRTVVGVVPNTRFRALREETPTIYLPWRQVGFPGTRLAVRSTLDPGALSVALRRALGSVDPTLTLWKVRPADALLGAPLSTPRLAARLFGAFGLAALALAAVGLFGVVASAVRERRREIGVRLALGATPAAIRRDVVHRALTVAGMGVAGGLAVALAGARLLRALLFETSPVDPLVLGAACLVLLVVAGLAALVPARAAMRIDPARTLQAD